MTTPAPAPALLQSLPSLDDVRRERYRRSFYAFLQDFWEIVEPAAAFMPARHLEALCQHFQAVYEGRIYKLNVEIGPGYAKSMVMSVFGPAWVWGPAGDPGFRFITSTQEHGLTIRDSLRFRSLIYSPEYQALWGHSVVPMADNNKQDYIENTARGFRVSKSVKGKATGHRAHMVITDDTLDATEAYSEAARQGVHAHLRALSSRRVDPKTFRWVNIGQRLHEDDAGGWCRAQGFETLCLPSEYDPSRHCTTSVGFSDWRTQRGELLFPGLYGEHAIREAKDQLGPQGYSAQHQQQPVPSEGGVLKRRFFRLFTGQAPHGFVFQSIDTAYTEKTDRDTSAITTWGVGIEGIYLLDAWTGRLEMPELLETIKLNARKWSPAELLIEAKANGLSIIQMLERDPSFGYRITPVVPKVSKDARAHAAAPFVARGRVLLPADAPMTEDLLRQAEIFPAGKVRDLADSAIQAWLHAGGSYTFGAAGYEYAGSSAHPDDDDPDTFNELH